MSDNPSAATGTTGTTPEVTARPRRRWLRVVLWLVIFVSGLIAGSGLTLIAVREGVLRAIHHPEEMPAKVAQRLRRPLGLTDEQTEQITQILRRRQKALSGIRRHYQPEVEHQLDLLEAEIGAVLDDRQRETWRRIFESKRRTWTPPMPPEDDAPPP